MVLCELTEEHLEAITGIEAVSSPAPWSRQLFAGELAMPPGERHWLVAMVGGAPGANAQVVGFIGSMLIADEAHIMNVAVAPAQRRRGIARVLVGQMLAELVERGVKHVTLEVRVDNHEARSLYESFGFGVEGERKDYYGPELHAWILWARNIDRRPTPRPEQSEDRS